MLFPRYLPYWILKVGRCPFTVSICYTKYDLFSTDSFITKLMVYTINTGCLTRYYYFQLTPYLDLYFVQHVFNGSPHYSEVPAFVPHSSSLMISYSAQ
jgi:hypothetical protein